MADRQMARRGGGGMFARLLIVAGLVVPVGLVVGAWPATGSQARQSATPLYTITDLGILPETGAEGVLVDDLNELGHVVGRVYGELPPQEWNRGYIYADASHGPIRGGCGRHKGSMMLIM
jgi:hypothetical protein